MSGSAVAFSEGGKGPRYTNDTATFLQRKRFAMQEQPSRPDIPRRPDPIDKPPPDIKPVPPPDIPPPDGPELPPPTRPERGDGVPAL